ncbi:hypothetical protein [Sulfitobacter indolifex]|uniref:hypothetical protein n=1 Tax=Sulfitobacter indolifex TaxID=225422 RepID=UPI0013EFB4AD|nr:hypothetical protein [Sulfitobacter indolifex]
MTRSWQGSRALGQQCRGGWCSYATVSPIVPVDSVSYDAKRAYTLSYDIDLADMGPLG